MNKEELYYSHPVQVKVLDVDPMTRRMEYYGGIAYHEYVVFGDCGGVALIKDVINAAEKEGKTADEAIIELSWVDIEEAILGDEYPCKC